MLCSGLKLNKFFPPNLHTQLFNTCIIPVVTPWMWLLKKYNMCIVYVRSIYAKTQKYVFGERSRNKPIGLSAVRQTPIVKKFSGLEQDIKISITINNLQVHTTLNSHFHKFFTCVFLSIKISLVKNNVSFSRGGSSTRLYLV